VFGLQVQQKFISKVLGMLNLEEGGNAWKKLEVITYGWVKAKSLTVSEVQLLLSCGEHFK
jgi:hypothetical protein